MLRRCWERGTIGLMNFGFRWFGAFVVSLVLPVVAAAQTLIPPSDVRNVTAEALDSSVQLNWDPATDDGSIFSYKVHYGVNSVTQAGDTYDQEVLTGSSDTAYLVTNLLNDNTYYFAVTAVDDQGLESELYSVEVEATPLEAVDPSAGAPILQSAAHIEQTKILVVMSEPVQVDDPTSAFEVVEDFTGARINVLNTQVNSQNVTLFVDANALLPNDIYRVTATVGVTDLDGNPVSSGVVDSVEFTAQSGFEVAPPPPPVEDPAEEEEEDETLLEEEDESPEPIISDETPTNPEPDDLDTFFLDDSRGSSDTADFLDSLLDPENPINNLETGNDLISEEDDSPVAQLPAEETQTPSGDGLSAAPDQIPPQDARNLSADASTASSGQVTVRWDKAVDLDNDIKDQVLYTRVGLGDWDQGLSLGKDVTQTTVAVVPNQNYQIRLVTVDTSNNESFGAAFEFSTTLNQSGGGGGTVIALSVLAALGLMFLFAGGRRA
jgi:hypothetical protein